MERLEAEETREHLVRMISSCKDNLLGCMVKIDGLEIGLCNNLNMIPVLEYEIAEIDKYLNGLENEYE